MQLPSKHSIDLSLYLVTSRVIKEGILAPEDFFRTILQSIEGGVRIVQLREKKAPARDMVAMGKRLLSFLQPLGIPLLINDRVDVAHAIHADGVHLGQSDLTVAEARAILGKDAIIGLSVATIEDAIAARDAEVDYLAASPVFSTATKLDCDRPWGLDGLRQLCSHSPHPIVAIGGINEANVGEVAACRVAGVAVVSAIFQAPCPKTAAKNLASNLTSEVKRHAASTPR